MKSKRRSGTCRADVGRVSACHAPRTGETAGPKKKKWFQVTHFPACSPVCARSLSVASSRSGRPSLRSAQRAFLRCASKLRATPACSAGRSRRLMTAFLSPASVVPRWDPQDGINVPGLPLQHPAEPSASPFGLRTPLPAFRLTPEWSRSMFCARCQPRDSAALRSSRIPAPLLGFHPSGS